MNIKLAGVTIPRRRETPEESTVAQMVVTRQHILGFVCIAASVATLLSGWNVGKSSTHNKSLRQADPRRDLLSSSQLGLSFAIPVPSVAVEDTRYLTFGTSDTWGAGIYQSQGNRSHAYPYLLSPNVKNAAGHMTDPTYPAVCAETITGEGHYDVIVIEYKPEKDSESLLTLSKRLRQRFPNALIIFLQLWDLFSLRTKTEDGFTLGFRRFQQAADVSDVPVQSLKFREAALNWTGDFSFIEDAALNQQYQEIIGAVQGLSMQLPRPDDAREALLEYTDWFTSGGHFLSEAGHAATATMIKEVVAAYNVTGQSMENRNALGSWAPGDSCHLWFMNGNVDLPYNAAKVDMVLFDNNPGRFGEYYALEFQNGGTLVVNNPFNESRPLSLTYMAEGPTSTSYPKTLVYFGGSVGVLDPYITHSTGSQQIHQPRTTSVGKVEPGNTTLHFNILENGKPAAFRLTGASFLAYDNLPVEYTLELHQAASLNQA